MAHFIQYTGPQPQTVQPHAIHISGSVAPQDTTRQPIVHHHHYQQQQHPQASASTHASVSASGSGVLAQGDWTKDLVQLAKTAELKKHALTLQLQTAHILSSHATLEEKKRTKQDIVEQRNKLESERQKLLNALRQVNEDRDKAEMMESTIDRECADLQTKITEVTEGDYASAKQDVDRLREELGQPPTPSLQSIIDEKAAQYLNDRRLNGPDAKRPGGDVAGQPTGKRARGRPKGSRSRVKSLDATGASSSAQ